mmetsp:Transcript_2633/g.5471  ORF Transcript_2633/g.5471 Transcript_2633/m.5471 type:complete len:456 (+) Transcript_2633:348-1715(+)
MGRLAGGWSDGWRRLRRLGGRRRLVVVVRLSQDALRLLLRLGGLVVFRLPLRPPASPRSLGRSRRGVSRRRRRRRYRGGYRPLPLLLLLLLRRHRHGGHLLLADDLLLLLLLLRRDHLRPLLHRHGRVHLGLLLGVLEGSVHLLHLLVVLHLLELLLVLELLELGLGVGGLHLHLGEHGLLVGRGGPGPAGRRGGLGLGGPLRDVALQGRREHARVLGRYVPAGHEAEEVLDARVVHAADTLVLGPQGGEAGRRLRPENVSGHVVAAGALRRSELLELRVELRLRRHGGLLLVRKLLPRAQVPKELAEVARASLPLPRQDGRGLGWYERAAHGDAEPGGSPRRLQGALRLPVLLQHHRLLLLLRAPVRLRARLLIILDLHAAVDARQVLHALHALEVQGHEGLEGRRPAPSVRGRLTDLGEGEVLVEGVVGVAPAGVGGGGADAGGGGGGGRAVA